MKEAKKIWINEKCESIDSLLVSNNKIYAKEKYLTKKK